MEEGLSKPEQALFERWVLQLNPALVALAADDAAPRFAGARPAPLLLARLKQGVRQAAPEAGQVYWSARAWTLLIWQPAFVAVAGVQGIGRAAPLGRLEQRLMPGAIYGFHLPRACWRGGDIDTVMAVAGERLRGLAEALYEQARAVFPLKRKSAERLLADTLMAALLRYAEIADRPAVVAQQLAEQWLHATGLAGESGLREGSAGLEVARRSCCMHYRLDEGDYCENCPVSCRLTPRAVPASMPALRGQASSSRM